MKLKIYEPSQLAFFPLYISTIDYNMPQIRITRSEGYQMNQVFFVSSGSGILKVDGNVYHLNTNDFFYLAANIPHEYYGIDDEFSTTYISFFGNGFEGIKKYYNIGDYGVYKNKNRGLFITSVKNLYEVFDKTHETSTLCSLTFAAVISYFEEACKKECDVIESVYKYIEENYSKMISLDDILSQYPFSKAKLCKDFKSKYGVAIFEMITSIRLRNAQYMINNYPNLKLKSIAKSCGFNDVSYFCKMYKKQYNYTPKSLKEKQ